MDTKTRECLLKVNTAYLARKESLSLDGWPNTTRYSEHCKFLWKQLLWIVLGLVEDRLKWSPEAWNEWLTMQLLFQSSAISLELNLRNVRGSLTTRGVPLLSFLCFSNHAQTGLSVLFGLVWDDHWGCLSRLSDRHQYCHRLCPVWSSHHEWLSPPFVERLLRPYLLLLI